jgi:hypothetical protein
VREAARAYWEMVKLGYINPKHNEMMVRYFEIQAEFLRRITHGSR